MKIQVAESGYKKLGSVKTRVVESETSKRSFSPELLRRVIPVLAIILFTFLVSSCDRGESAGEKPVVVVTILPQVEFVKEVGGDRVVVTVMVPPGANAHIYEPTPSQMMTLSEASMYAKVGSGIEFELTWMEKLRAANEEMMMVDCSAGVPLQEVTDESDSSEIDPHIWMSPGNVAIMVRNIYDGLVTIDAVNKAYYARNRDAYLRELYRLDQKIRDSLSAVPDRTFMVYHPSLGYFAREYDLTMLSIENEGKEPTAAGMVRMIAQAKERNITVIFADPQFNPQSVRVIADAIGGRIVFIDPQAGDYLANMGYFLGELVSAMNRAGR